MDEISHRVFVRDVADGDVLPDDQKQSANFARTDAGDLRRG